MTKKKEIPYEPILIHRSDGCIELQCVHGVGHTIYNPNRWGKYTFSHGCCQGGCCSSETFKLERKRIKKLMKK